MYTCVYTYTCIHIYIYIYVYHYLSVSFAGLLPASAKKTLLRRRQPLAVYIYIHIYMHIYIYIYAYVFILYIYIHTCNTYMYYMYVYIYIYIYIMCQLDNCQIRGWRAVSAAASLGKGSSTRSVLSQTPVSLLLACTLSSYIAIDHYWSWHVFVIITVYHCARPLNQVLPSHRSIYLRCAHDTN